MKRRTCLAALCSAGVVATTAGCSSVGGEQTLSDPTVTGESEGRRTLVFTVDGEKVGHFGVRGEVASNRLHLSTEIWHREGTTVESVMVRVWMPQTAPDTPAEVAVVSPVEGDSSPPPSLALYTPDRAPGTVIEITDLDDLADETISTLDLRIEPRSGTASTLALQPTIELSGGGVLSSDYTLDGELRVAFPALASQ